MISQKERKMIFFFFLRKRERDDWLLNLRQLRFNGEVINTRNISNLFGGKMMCIYFFIFLRRGRWWVEREIYIRSGFCGGDKEMISQKEREKERGLIVEFKAIEI